MSASPPQSSQDDLLRHDPSDNKDVTTATATIVITTIIKSCYYYQWCKNIYFHQKNTTNLQEESTIKLENMVSGPPSVETSHWGYLGYSL